MYSWSLINNPVRKTWQYNKSSIWSCLSAVKFSSVYHGWVQNRASDQRQRTPLVEATSRAWHQADVYIYIYIFGNADADALVIKYLLVSEGRPCCPPPPTISIIANSFQQAVITIHDDEIMTSYYWRYIISIIVGSYPLYQSLGCAAGVMTGKCYQ